MGPVDHIYDALADEAAYARLPAAIADATRGRSAIIIEFDEQLRPYSWVRHGIPEEINNRYIEADLARHDVWTNLIAQAGRLDHAVLTEEFVDADRFRETIFHNELYRPFGDDTARCLGVLMRRPTGFMSVGVHRGHGQPQFEPEDAAALDGLLPHLKRLSEVRARLKDAETRSSLLGAALDHLPAPLIITRADGRVRHCNARAETLLRARGGLALHAGRLIPAGLQEEARFAEALRSAATRTDGQGDAMRLRRGEDLPPIRVLITPLSGPTGGSALVLVDVPEDRDPQMADTLRRLYGLTASEAELVAHLDEGLSPREAADARGVRLSTVRSQIATVIQKTEARGLGDLMRGLGRTPRLGRPSSGR